jgi:hypothetical protein
MYDPSFLGAYGRLRQAEMLADAKRRAARWKANPARAHWREQRAERRRRWYLPMSWRSGVRVRRKPSESDLPPNIGMSTCVGCAREENVNNPAAVNASARAEAVEVVFEAGQTSHLDALDFLSQVRRPCCRSKRHLLVVWLDIRELFGAVLRPDTKLGGLGAALGLICLMAAILGLGRVAWTWRRASRAEQLLAAAIVCNVGVFALSVMPLPSGYREIVALLPCGAALAARALVPARITGELRAFAAVTATALVALLPLSVAATRPAVGPAMGPAPGNGATAQTAPLTAWLEAHGLSYGVAGYWDASVISLQSGDKVRIRAIDLDRTTSAAGWKVNEPYWETNALWYDPSRYDASFAVADTHGIFSRTALEGVFGQPSASYRVEDWYVLVYRTNLLRKILPPLKAQ